MTRRAPTLDGPGVLGKRIGLRMVPELHRELRMMKARTGETMEDLVHKMLCKALKRPDLAGLSPSDPAP